MHYKSSAAQVDPAAVQKQLDNLTIPGLDAPGGLPELAPPTIQ